MNAASRQPKLQPEFFQRSFGGNWDEIGEAAEWLNAVAYEKGVSDESLFNMQVCLEELFTNIVKHGGSDVQTESAKSLTVGVSVTFADGEVVLTIEDNGKPFDIAAARAHAIDKPLSDLKPGGLGVQLIKSFASDISYERAGLGNRVTLRFLPQRP